MTAVVKKICLSSLVAILTVLTGLMGVQAQAIQGQRLKVEPYLPNAASQAKGYYIFEAGSTPDQVISVQLTNTSAQTIRYQAQIKDAQTDSNGQITYRKAKAAFGVRQFTKQPDHKGQLAPGDSKRLTFALTIPSQSALRATCLGALVVHELPGKQTKPSNQLQNNFTLTTSIVLQQGQAESHDLQVLNLTDVRPSQQVGESGYTFTLENKSDKLIANLQAKLTVTQPHQQAAQTTLPKVTLLAHGKANLFLPALVTNPFFTKATLQLKQGRQEAGLTFKPAKDSKDKRPAPSRTNHHWVVLLGLSLLIGGGLFYNYYRRRATK